MITCEKPVPPSVRRPQRANDITGVVLEYLLRAQQYAIDCGSDAWDFAVEIEELRCLGASNSEFRWLLTRDYACHRLETTLAGEDKRQFASLGKNNFPARTCFVLTEIGRDFLDAEGPPEFSPTQAFPTNGASGPGNQSHGHLPTWDVETKELRVAQLLVKRFRWPAPNQEMLLAVFQEEDWPRRIDDPLPRVEEQDPRRRLHDTIKCLNRNQVHPLVRFRGDGSGEGVLWEHRPDADASEDAELSF